VDPIKALYMPNPVTQIEASEDKNFQSLKNHIVVCGIHSSISQFVLPLRTKYLKNYLQDIVIITDIDPLPAAIWESISKF
jgi:hypothetical protein